MDSTKGTSWNVEEAAAALELRGIQSHRVGGPESWFKPWNPRSTPQIAMESPSLPLLLPFWVVGVNEGEWWLCRVSHGSYPFTADKNRCHLFSEAGATGFHLTRGLLSIKSFLHFHFLPTIFLYHLYPFLHRPLSQIWIRDILMKCEKSKVCKPLTWEWVASFEFERILPFMVSQHSNMSNNNHKQQDII
jgi:hypothetical protein